MAFVCRCCCRPATTRGHFFLTNCYHLVCGSCLKKCLVSTTPDSAGLYSITCPVEKKVHKVMPIEQLPPEGKALFGDVNKVLEKNTIIVKLLEKKLLERMALIEHLSTYIETILKENYKLRKRIASVADNGFSCERCGQRSFFNLNTSANSLDSNPGLPPSISGSNELAGFQKPHHSRASRGSSRLSAGSHRSDTHQKAVTNFLSDHRLLKTENKALYYIDATTAQRILEKVDIGCKQFKVELQLKTEEDSRQLRDLEARQLHIANIASTKPCTSHVYYPAIQTDQTAESDKIISRDQSEIGPSYDDFQQHLKSVKVKKEQMLFKKRGYNIPNIHDPDITLPTVKLKHVAEESNTFKGVQVQPYKRRRKE